MGAKWFKNKNKPDLFFGQSYAVMWDVMNALIHHLLHQQTVAVTRSHFSSFMQNGSTCTFAQPVKKAWSSLASNQCSFWGKGIYFYIISYKWLSALVNLLSHELTAAPCTLLLNMPSSSWAWHPQPDTFWCYVHQAYSQCAKVALLLGGEQQLFYWNIRTVVFLYCF